jgi:hypothetical protein
MPDRASQEDSVRPSRIRRLAPTLAVLTLLTLSAGTVTAHVIEHPGSYTLALGWQREPAYVGFENAIQVIVTDAAGKPVADLGPDDLSVVVSIAGQQSAPLSFANGFDEDTGLGKAGEYDASILPTSPGDYTFHLTGTIHGTAVDVAESSSEQTFDSVVGTTDVEFPAKLPTMDEVSTRLDRIDARVTALGGGASVPTKASVEAAVAAAADARTAADRALLIGEAIGGLGVLVAILALIRSRPSRRVAA